MCHCSERRTRACFSLSFLFRVFDVEFGVSLGLLYAVAVIGELQLISLFLSLSLFISFFSGLPVWLWDFHRIWCRDEHVRCPARHIGRRFRPRCRRIGCNSGIYFRTILFGCVFSLIFSALHKFPQDNPHKVFDVWLFLRIFRLLLFLLRTSYFVGILQKTMPVTLRNSTLYGFLHQSRNIDAAVSTSTTKVSNVFSCGQDPRKSRGLDGSRRR